MLRLAPAVLAACSYGAAVGGAGALGPAGARGIEARIAGAVGAGATDFEVDPASSEATSLRLETELGVDRDGLAGGFLTGVEELRFIAGNYAWHAQIFDGGHFSHASNDAVFLAAAGIQRLIEHHRRDRYELGMTSVALDLFGGYTFRITDDNSWVHHGAVLGLAVSLRYDVIRDLRDGLKPR